MAGALATGNGQGVSSITAQFGGITSAPASLTVTPPILVSLAVMPGTASIAKGRTQPFTVSGTMTDGTSQDFSASAAWVSSNPSVASMSGGIANGNGLGTSNITAQSGSITSSPAQLTVTAPVLVSLSVSPNTASIAAGLTQQFSVKGTLSDGSTQDYTANANWSSDNPAVATINSVGLATSLIQGTSNITAQSGGITSRPAVLTVTAPVLASLAVTPGAVSVPKGLTQQFKATGTLTDGTSKDYTASATWAALQLAVASIDASGLATTLAQGATGITAQVGNVTSQASVLTVIAPTLVSLAVNPAQGSIALGFSQQFTATGTMTDGSTQDYTSLVGWSTNPSSIALVSSGLVRTLAVGSAQVIATSGNIFGSGALTVIAPALLSIAITPRNPTVPNGIQQAFSAIGAYSDTSTKDLTTQVTWASSDRSIASISAMGLASTLKQGGTSISATLGGVSSQTTLNVSAPTLVSIAVAPPKASVVAGLTQPFTATGTYTDSSTADVSGQVSWSAAPSTLSTISNTGLAKGLAPGTATITATLGGLSGSAYLGISQPTLVSLAITPSTAAIGIGKTQSFMVIGTRTDGSNQDYTTAATWTSSLTSVATVSAGVATGLAGGTSTITAAVGVLSASATLNVASIAISNLHNNSIVETGFMVGSSVGVNTIGVRYDHGPIQLATGNTNWRIGLPLGPNAWRLGSKHTITVGSVSPSGTTISSEVSITVIKGMNQDIDGDGYPDIIVGDSSFRDFVGRAYVFLTKGRHGLGNDKLVASQADYIITGSTSVQGEFGVSVVMGDFNGDGYADLAIGADSYIDCVRCSLGKTYVFLSQGQTALGISPSVSALDADTCISGEGTQNLFGVVSTAGDVNGDGFDDLLVADVDGYNGNGRAYLFSGSSKGLVGGAKAVNAIDTANTIFNGAGHWFGASVAIGDVNGDGFPDIAVGVPWAGKAYIYNSPGAAGYPASVNTTQATSVFSGSSADVGNWFGEIIALGDINGSGRASLLVSAPGPEEITVSNGNWVYLNRSLGKVYAFTPSSTGFAASIASSNANTVLVGENNGDDFGVSLAVGDVNGDGYQDVAVGANTYNNCQALNQYALDGNCEGRAYIFQTGPGGLGATTIAANNASTVMDAHGDPGNFGFSLAFSDVNGDGYQDLLVGGNGAGAKGKIYLFNGGNSGLGNVVQNKDAQLTIVGEIEAGQKADTLGDAAE
jgi:hypothetical protein